MNFCNGKRNSRKAEKISQRRKHSNESGEMMKSRVEEAVSRFEKGYNCSQAVFATYADLFGMDEETALKLASSMGGGMGRMREVCGAVSAMALLEGLKEGNTDPADKTAQGRTYETVRDMSDSFASENGSIICRELLGIAAREKSAAPSERTKEYYQSRPCTKLVACAARIVEEQLLADRMEQAIQITDIAWKGGN